MTELPREVESAIDDVEEVHWSGRPNRTAQVVATLLGTLFFAVFFFGIIGAILGSALAAAVGSLTVTTAVAGVVGLLVVVFVGWTLGNLYVGGTYHVMTDDKAVYFNDNIGESDLAYVRWENVSNVDVTEGIVDGVFDTGTVSIEAQGSDDIEFHHVDGPYGTLETARDLRETSDQ